MSVDDAYVSLGLERGHNYDETTIRKAYYKLAQINHPDKNPKGRVSNLSNYFCIYSTYFHITFYNF